MPAGIPPEQGVPCHVLLASTYGRALAADPA